MIIELSFVWLSLFILHLRESEKCLKIYLKTLPSTGMSEGMISIVHEGRAEETESRE